MPATRHGARHARVLVVGGGIAGAAACISLAKAGLRAHWLTRETAPTTEAVGESLAPASLPILSALGLESIIDSTRHRHGNATFSAWGSSSLMERNAFLHLEGPGRVLDRRFFEEQLRQVANGLATKITGSFEAMAPSEHGPGWSLTLDNGKVITTDFLIDATGRAALIGRRMSHFERTDQLVAAVAFLQQTTCDVEPTRATLIEAVAQGWWYATLLPDNRLGLAYFSDPDLLPSDLSRDMNSWRHLLADTLHAGRWVQDAQFALDKPPRLVSAGSARISPPCSGNNDHAGWAAIGDAAAAFDPLSSHGITTALWTGARMGTVVPEWIEGNREPLTCYGEAVCSGYTSFLRQREAMYGREQRFADQLFWQRRRT